MTNPTTGGARKVEIRTVTKPVGPFRYAEEARCYRLLHEHGIEALDAHTPYSSDLLNAWHDAGMIRITYPDGGLHVRTFAKWDRVAAAMVTDSPTP